MSSEQNKTNVRRGFEEGINQRKLAVFDELLAPNYVNHSLPAPLPGRRANAPRAGSPPPDRAGAERPRRPPKPSAPGVDSTRTARHAGHAGSAPSPPLPS